MAKLRSNVIGGPFDGARWEGMPVTVANKKPFVCRAFKHGRHNFRSLYKLTHGRYHHVETTHKGTPHNDWNRLAETLGIRDSWSASRVAPGDAGPSRVR